MKNPIRILITGATGFVGSALCQRLLADGYAVCGTLLPSESPATLVAGARPVRVEPLGSETVWDGALAGVDTVIHLAARVHVMNDSCADPLEEFRRVNVAGTLKLARDAANAGVRRLVFVSSIKVNGEEACYPYTCDSLPNPTDPYGISKAEAEQGLRALAGETGLEVVIVRPTLVYGPGVRANFLSMLQVVQRGVPLPLASLRNKRSLTYLGNLVDALTACALHPAAAGRTYLLSDGEDVSTPELLRRCAAALGVPARLLPFPAALLSLAGKLTGRGATLDRLTGSLAVDNSGIREELGWTPPFTMEQGLAITAAWFLKQRPSGSKPSSR